MRLDVFFAILCCGATTLAAPGPAIPEKRPALLVIENDLSRDTDFQVMIQAAVSLLGDTCEIGVTAARAFTWPVFSMNEECRAPDQTVVGLGGDFDRARRLFFERMDTTGAVQVLEKSVGRFLSAPCLALDRPEFKLAGCRAGVLLTRLYLLEGRAEPAAALSADLVARCSSADIESEDVPPDVFEFIGRALSTGEEAASNGLPELRIFCPGDCDGLLLDSKPLNISGGWGVARLKTGFHKIDFIDSSGSDTAWYSAGFEFTATGTVLVVDASGSATAVGPGVFAVTGGISHAAEVLGLLTDMVVLGLFEEAPGFAVKRIFDPAGASAGGILTGITRESSGYRFTAPRGSPVVLVPKPAWPWPWVTGAVSAGLLATGIALNVVSNQTVQSINPDMSRATGLKNGAIAGYALAGAGILTTILLAVLRPEPGQTVLVVPSSSGFSLIF